MHGKSIELFLVNGSADSIVTAELSNWNGKAIKIPRIEVSDCKETIFRNLECIFYSVKMKKTMKIQFI